MSRGIYTRERYLADVAALDARRAEAPALRVELARQLTSELETVAPVSAVVRRLTLLGLGAVEPPPQAPVTERVLRAVGLSKRPSGRAR